MSRIHEALQRAEQEKSAQERCEPRPPLEPERHPPLDGSLFGQEPPATVPESWPLSAVAGSLSLNVLDFETLAARCSRPEWKPDPRTVLFFQKENHQYDTEIFRTLRSRLYRLRESTPLRTLLVTSALPAEGKSFIAANLAQVIAQQHGRRALLIDADLRAPRLHVLFGAPQTPGLTDYLAGEVDEFAVIQKSPLDDLFCITGGKIPKNPVESICNGKLKVLLNRVAPIFDWVILDSPPMVPVSDASLLAEMSDGVLLVVRAGTTPFDLARKVRMELGNTPLVGVALNCVSQASSYGAEYYSYYGHSKAEKGSS